MLGTSLLSPGTSPGGVGMTFNKLFTFETLDSTNNHAKHIAQDATDGTVIVAGIQTKGKGRSENTWSSETGGLYLSVILKPRRPPQRTLPLTLITALAVSETLDTYGIPSTIKWPNDVLVNEKKIAGILVESSSSGAELNYLIIGVGININNPLSDSLPATSLGELKNEIMDITRVRDVFLKRLYTLYSRFLDEGFTELKKQWVDRAGAGGKRLRDRETGDTLGDFLGLSDDGGILYRPQGKGDTIVPQITHITDIDFF